HRRGFLAFFFQAEDGIRDGHVTGVQTCALPIWRQRSPSPASSGPPSAAARPVSLPLACSPLTSPPLMALFPSPSTSACPACLAKIGRASCRQRVAGQEGVRCSEREGVPTSRAVV